jgi:hypothetical protein
MPDGAQDRTRKLVRGAVLKTNPYPPFRFLNRLPYRWALRAVRKIARTIPEIRSIGVRNGFATGDWIPGLSDIDLLAIVSQDLEPEREFAVVDSFRASYFQLQRTFPMLGELVMLAEDDLDAWLPPATFTPGKLPLATIHGVPIELPEEESPRWRENALNIALWIYLDLLPPTLSQPPGYLREQDSARRMRKIARLVAPLVEPTVAGAAAAGVAGAVKIMEAAVRTIDSNAFRERPEPSWFPLARNRCQFAEGSAAGVAGVQSVVEFGGRTLVVVSDGFPLERLREIAADVERFGPSALPLACNTFAYTVRRYNPHAYGRLFEKRTILWGADPLAEIDPPGRLDFASYAESRSAGIISFARGEEIFQTPLPLLEFENEIERAMELRYALGANWVHPDRSETGRRWRSEFPEHAEAVRRIREHAENGGELEARRAAFFFFRSLQRELRQLLESSDERMSHSLGGGSGF